MACNNIFNLKLENIDSKCVINYKNAINVDFQSASKAVGGASYSGDLGRNADFGKNIYIDPNLVDNPHVGIMEEDILNIRNKKVKKRSN